MQEIDQIHILHRFS